MLIRSYLSNVFLILIEWCYSLLLVFTIFTYTIMIISTANMVNCFASCTFSINNIPQFARLINIFYNTRWLSLQHDINL